MESSNAGGEVKPAAAKASKVKAKGVAGKEGNKGKGAIGATAADDVATGTLSLSKMEKGDIVKKFQLNSQDVGSPEVQVALLTRRLESMTKHFSSHPKDFHSQRGMLDLISRRKRLLTYLRRENVGRYRATIGALGLRK